MLAGVALLLPALALAQASVQPQPQRTGWTLQIHRGDVITATVHATDVPLSQLAADLARQLKVPVMVEPAVGQVAVTVRLDNRELDEALRLLAPQVRVYADYEVTATAPAAKPLAIFFQSDAAEPPPLPVGKAASEVHVISGDTEAGERTPARAQTDAPLLVEFENHVLTVRARQQPLIAIIYAVAGKLDASVSVATQTSSLQQLLTAPADVQLQSGDIEAGVLSLSPAVQLYVRRDLQSAEMRILRITLVEPPDRF